MFIKKIIIFLSLRLVTKKKSLFNVLFIDNYTQWRVISNLRLYCRSKHAINMCSGILYHHLLKVCIECILRIYLDIIQLSIKKK